MNKIEYTPDNLSHHKVNIYNWITHGIIINGSRYILKEFIINSNRLSAIVTNDNKNYYITDLTSNVTEEVFDDSNILKRLDRLESIPQYKYDDTGILIRLDNIDQIISDISTRLDSIFTLISNNKIYDDSALVRRIELLENKLN